MTQSHETCPQPLDVDDVEPVSPGSGRFRGLIKRDIETPLGLVKEEDVRPLHFPRGLIGFSQDRSFGLCAFPKKQLPQFLFLKCFNRLDLSFIVLPFHAESALIREQDLQYLAESVAVDFKHALFFALITILEKEGVRGFFANLRAPLVVNIATSEAWQAVWPHNNYSIRHPIATVTEQVEVSQPQAGAAETVALTSSA